MRPGHPGGSGRRGRTVGAGAGGAGGGQGVVAAVGTVTSLWVKEKREEREINDQVQKILHGKNSLLYRKFSDYNCNSLRREFGYLPTSWFFSKKKSVRKISFFASK